MFVRIITIALFVKVRMRIFMHCLPVIKYRIVMLIFQEEKSKWKSI